MRPAAPLPRVERLSARPNRRASDYHADVEHIAVQDRLARFRVHDGYCLAGERPVSVLGQWLLVEEHVDEGRIGRRGVELHRAATGYFRRHVAQRHFERSLISTVHVVVLRRTGPRVGCPGGATRLGEFVEKLRVGRASRDADYVDGNSACGDRCHRILGRLAVVAIHLVAVCAAIGARGPADAGALDVQLTLVCRAGGHRVTVRSAVGREDDVRLARQCPEPRLQRLQSYTRGGHAKGAEMAQRGEQGDSGGAQPARRRIALRWRKNLNAGPALRKIGPRVGEDGGPNFHAWPQFDDELAKDVYDRAPLVVFGHAAGAIQNEVEVRNISEQRLVDAVADASVGSKIAGRSGPRTYDNCPQTRRRGRGRRQFVRRSGGVAGFPAGGTRPDRDDEDRCSRPKRVHESSPEKQALQCNAARSSALAVRDGFGERPYFRTVLNVRTTATGALRVAVATAIVVIALGGIPGARLRSFDVIRPVPSEVKQRDGVIDVAVHDGPSGPPIVGAQVRALAILDDRAYLADERETDRSGMARVAHLPRGEIWILAEAPGHARGSSHTILVDSHRDIAIDLLAEHAIGVVVHDELGLPVAVAEVEVVSRGDPLPIGARTDAAGLADVTRLGPGPWRVTVRSPGYEDSTGSAQHDGETARIVLRKLGAISVHVVAAGDREVARARIAVGGAMLWPARSAETDVHGDVRVAGLAAGTYAVRASKEDRVSPTDLGIVLGRGEEKRVVLRLTQGHFANVRVTDGDAVDAKPIRGARVTLVEGGLSPFPLEATTDSLGRARPGPIAPGSATLGVQAEGFMPRGAILVSDPPAPETRVALARSGALSGRVVDTRGDPIDGATIEVAGTDVNGGPIFDDPRRSGFQAAHFDAMLGGPTPLVPAGELGVLPGPVPPIPPVGLGLAGTGAQPANARRLFADPWVTRIDGFFRAAPASPGRIRAIVHHPQYVEAQSEVVNLAPGGEAHVEVAMHRGGALEGRVVDARERPVAGVRVFVSARAGSFERSTRTASDGTFALAALPADVTITVASRDDEVADARLEAAIPEGGRKEVRIVLDEPKGPLAVSVVDERGWPVANAQVSASSLSAESMLRTTAFTDAHGDAQLKRARGLPLRIEVRAPSRAPRVVTTDGARETVRIDLSPAESATGTVVASRGGEALAGADVTLYTETGARHTRTDAHGGFTLADLAHGAVRLHVRARGFAPAARALTVPDHGGQRPYVMAVIEMVAEGVVEGDVVDAQGDPVAGARVALDHAPTWLLIGSNPEQMAVTDAKGRFALRELPEGSVNLEAYAPDLGRALASDVRIVADRTTRDVHLVISPGAAEGATATPTPAGGSVAVTLGETDAPTEIVVVSVVEGSQAERAGVSPGDVLLAVDSTPVVTMAQARAKLSGPVADEVLISARRGDRVLTLRVGRDAVRR